MTKEPCDVQLVVRLRTPPGRDLTSTPVRTRSLGKALHVVLCHLTTSAAPLSADTLYEYDLRMTRVATGITETLAGQADLLTGSTPLGFETDRLPAFMLPPPVAALNLVHSSCRKPHGGGPDALTMIDRLLVLAHNGPTEADRRRARPHQLLLTGDQIYADDVALTMLATLQEAGGAFCAAASQEQFPRGSGASTVVMTAAEVAPGTRRKGFLDTESKLSSDEGMNHLMFFAEFAAMYIVCWSDEVWPRAANGSATVGTAPVEFWLAHEERKQRKELLSFVGTLRRVRRVLANVPTMMMFDDHEISDDWNLDGLWAEDSRSNPPLKRIVRNGLLAFAVFQAWGNDPARFQSGTPLALLDAVTLPVPAGDPPIHRDPTVVDVELGLSADHGLPANVARRMKWDWTLPAVGHLVIALDSRTWRDYASVGPLSAGLITEAELDRQLSAYRPNVPTDTILRIVVAPAPVLGHPFVERELQPRLQMYKSVKAVDPIRGGRAADNESWGVNRFTYQSILRRLAEFGRVVVLSGDVHYGYTNQTEYFGASGLAPARIVQLCSSAAKNAEMKTRAIQGAGLVRRRGESWLGIGTPLPTDTRRELLSALGAAVRTPLNPIERNLLDRAVLFELLETPAIIPLHTWRLPTASRRVVALADRNDTRDWRYRTTFAFDERSPEKRLTDAIALDPRARPIGLLHVTKQAHKVVVGEPNVGLVTIRTSAAGVTEVIHRLHYVTDVGPDGALAYTEHKVRLDPPTLADRPEPVR
ncbi:MAG: hypothetical protein IPJ14_19175 [Kineosporiaceae bacterium]|nr:hypothetical protein [Kineosporiaceae bacterium]